jgi:hypothetical protein
LYAPPLPRIDDTIDTLSGAKYFSTADLKSGYYQTPVAEKDRHKTAFSFLGRGKMLNQENFEPLLHFLE